MKNMKKIVAVLLSMTAIASTTALAAVREDIEATYADGTASLAVTTANFSAAADDQLTVVIVPKDAEEITSGNIYYINQGAFEAEFIGILNEMKVKDGFGEAKDYEVRVGGITADGNYTVDTIYFKAEEEEVIFYGDVNGDGKGPNAADKAYMARFLAKWTDYLDGGKNAINRLNADVSKPDGKGTTINAADKAVLLRHLAKWEGYEKLPMN